MNILGRKLKYAFWMLPSDGETKLDKEAAESTLLQVFKAQLDKATVNLVSCWWQSHFNWEVRLETAVGPLPPTLLTTLPFLDTQEKRTFLWKMQGMQSLWWALAIQGGKSGALSWFAVTGGEENFKLKDILTSITVHRWGHYLQNTISGSYLAKRTKAQPELLSVVSLLTWI